MPIDRGINAISEPGQGLLGVGKGHDRSEDVAIGGFDRHARRDQITLDRIAIGSGTESTSVSLSGSTSGPSSTARPSTCCSRSRAARVAAMARPNNSPVALEQGAGCVGAGEDGSGGARRRGGLHAGIQPCRVDPIGAG